MFSCPTCRKKFPSRTNLASHLRDHAANVNQDSSRASHPCARVKTNSELLDDVYCPYCNSSFMNNIGLRVHVAKIHKAQYKDFENMREYSVARQQTSSTRNIQKNYKDDPGEPTLSSPGTKVASKAPQFKPWNNYFTYGNSSEKFNEKSTPLREQSESDVLFCSLCHDEFYEQLYLDVHVRDWHKENTQPGPVTTVKITSSSSNANSSKKEMSESYKCSLCKKAFVRKDQLKTHRAIHKRRQTFSCEICGRRFLSVNERNAHKLSAHRHKVVLTATSHTTVLQNEKLTRKLSISTSSDNDTESINIDSGGKKKEKRGKSKFDLYQCPICDYRDSTDPQLAQHVDTVHAKGGIYECRHCDIVTIMAQDLLLHVRTHDQEKPFSCDICGLRFREREAKYKHQESHDDEIDDLL